MEKLCSIQKFMIEEFKRVNSNQQKIMNVLNELKKALHTGELAISTAETNAISSTDKIKFEEVMWRNVPNFHYVFDNKLLRPVLTACIFKLLEGYINNATNEKSDEESKSAEVINLLFFATMQEESKTNNDKGIGPKVSIFKKSIVQSCIFLAKNDTFNLFRNGDLSLIHI